MIVPTSEMSDFFSDPSEAEFAAITLIHEDVELLVKQFCKREFESTSYSKKRYDGNGENILFLEDYPLTAVDRVSINILDVLKVKNTNANSTASVSVTSTGIRLVYNGTANTSITFAANTTMSAVATAISAISGWSAEVLSSVYSNFKSTELIEVYGLNAINNNWAYLCMPDDAEDSFSVDLNKGYIRRSWGWPIGSQNIIVDCTAGYSSTNMPKDLKLAIKILTKYFHNRNDEDGFGVKRYKMENIEEVFEDKDIPKEVNTILNRYRRRLV